MDRREETTELVQVWQEAREAGDDPVRALMQVLLQGLLEEEMTAHVGAGAVRADRGASGPSQRLQAAGAQDPRRDAGPVGAAGSPGAVPDGTVRAVPAEREGVGAGVG